MPSSNHRLDRARRRGFKPAGERLEARALLAVDLDDQLSEAIALGPVTSPRTTAGIISEATDVDMYAFEVQAGHVVEFDIDTPTNGVPGLGSHIRIFDANGNELAANNDAQAPSEPQPPPGTTHLTTFFDSYLRYTFGTAGTYYIGVSNWENTRYSAVAGTGDSVGSQHLTGPYTLTISTKNPDVYLDRGADGLWGWTAGLGLAQLNAGNPEAMAVAPDGTLFVDFGPYGLWTRVGTRFVQINGANPENMVVAADGSLYLDYGSFGLWRYSTAGLKSINGANPENMAPAADGSLYLDFGPFGLWRLAATGAISQINPANPEGLAAASDGTLFIDFGTSGLWRWSAGDLTRIISGNPERLHVGRDGFLYIDFGSVGLWRRSPAGSFSIVTSYDVESLAG